MKIFNHIFRSFTRRPIILAACLLSFGIFLSGECVFSAEYKFDNQEPTVVAPGGLSERERSALSKQYTYEVRRKEMLLYPDAGVGGASGERYESEGEKYHTYLGTAVDLYMAGELEEAAKIFKYLSEVDPGDKYVKSYISRIKREMPSYKSRWKNQSEADAVSLRKQKIRNLLRYGAESFKNKDFDGALVSFKDVLSIDPNNFTARSYMKKLKAHYSKKMQAEKVVQNWSLRKSAPSALEKEADRMLDRGSGRGEEPAEKTLDHAELEFLVDGIIASKRDEEARANQMVLGAGDILRISVLNHPELSGDITVQSGGEIVLPLTGDVVAARGLSVSELSEKVRHVLDEYIQSSNVFIALISSKSQIFFVIDEISCTPYPLTRPNLTLRDALFMSDWGNNRALGRVIVMKPSARNPIIKKVDAFNLIFRADLRDNVRISNGDVIYIPMTYAAKVTKTIYDTLAPFRAVRAARDEFLNEKWNREDYEQFFKLPDAYTADRAAGITGMSESATSDNFENFAITTSLSQSY